MKTIVLLPTHKVLPEMERHFILPKILINSYLGFDTLNEQAEKVKNNPRDEYQVKALMVILLNQYFKLDGGFLVVPENKENK